jgi:hypothetical protein
VTLPVIEGVFQAVIFWESTDGQTARNVLYFRNTLGGGMADLAGFLDSEATANMFHTMSDSASAPEVRIQPLDGESSQQSFPLTTWAGTEPGDYIPAGSCVLTLYTGLTGKSRRGRIYLPFANEGAQTDGHWIGDADTVVEPAWNAFVSAMQDNDWSLVVASLILFHTDHGVPTDPSVPFATDVTQVKQQHFLGTQRRRQSRLRH